MAIPRRPRSIVWALAMVNYRAYLIDDRDGHFIRVREIEAADDHAATIAAMQFVDGHDIELWCRDRLIASLSAKPNVE